MILLLVIKNQSEYFFRAVDPQNCTSIHFKLAPIILQHQELFHPKIFAMFLNTVNLNKLIITIIVKFLTGLLLIPKVFKKMFVLCQNKVLPLYFCKECVKTHQSL